MDPPLVLPGLAAWPSGLGKGLQSPVPGFDSRRRLRKTGIRDTAEPFKRENPSTGSHIRPEVGSEGRRYALAVTRRQFLRRLTLVAAAGFAGRVAYIFAVTRRQTVSFDEFYYIGAAANLAHGRGFTSPPLFGPPGRPDALHPPLPQVVLAPVSRLTDGSHLALRLTVALAGALVIVVIGLLTSELAGHWAGLVAAGLAAAYPNLWVNDGLVLSETFATLGTAATVWFSYRLARRPTWLNAAAVGVAAASAMLSRGELVLLIPLLIVPAVLTIRKLRLASRVVLTAVAVLVAALAIGPWVAYNLTRFERPVLLSYNDGGVFRGANCEATYSGPLIGLWHGPCTVSDQQPEANDPSVTDGRKRTEAFHYMRQHLGRLPVVVAVREARIWGAYRPFQMARISTAEGRPRWVSLLGWGSSWALLLLAVPGAMALRRRAIPLTPLLVPLLIVAVTAAVFYGIVRFRTPAEPSIVVLAAVGLDSLVFKHQGAGREPTRQVREEPSSVAEAASQASASG